MNNKIVNNAGQNLVSCDLFEVADTKYQILKHEYIL